MNAFRDEREAMLERLHQLEEELAGVRDPEKREALLRELSSLANRVEVATRRVDEDARSLDEIGRSIERMRASIGGKPEVVSETTNRDAHVDAPAGPGRAAWLASGALVLAGIIGAVAMSSSKRAAIDMTSPASSIAGFPNAVDPSALVEMARTESRLGKDARLTGIRVDYATPDGRVNLRGQGYAGQVTYSFILPVPAAATTSSAPVGAPPPLKPMPRSSTVTLSASGIAQQPMILVLYDDPIGDPQCTVAQVWSAAKNAGAPSEAIAVLEYGTANVFTSGHFEKRTRWRFTIQGTKFDFEIADPGCELLKK